MNEGNFYLKKIQIQKQTEKQASVIKQEEHEHFKVETELITPENWQKLKEIRLDAVKNNPKAFTSKKSAKTLYETEFQKTDQEWIDEVSNIDKKFFVVANNPSNQDEAISMAGAKKGDKFWRIINVYTKNDFLHKGTSKQVLEKIFEKLKEKEVKEVFLFVRKAQEQRKAVNLYKKLGFKAIDVVSAFKKYKFSSINWGIMELDLTKKEDKL